MRDKILKDQNLINMLLIEKTEYIIREIDDLVNNQENLIEITKTEKPNVEHNRPLNHFRNLYQDKFKNDING